MIVKYVIASIVAFILSYIVSTSIHAKMCTILSIPYNKYSDVDIYDRSVANIKSLKWFIYYIPICTFGPFAFFSKTLPQNTRLFIIIASAILVIVSSSILSNKLFKNTINKISLDEIE